MQSKLSELRGALKAGLEQIKVSVVSVINILNDDVRQENASLSYKLPLLMFGISLVSYIMCTYLKDKFEVTLKLDKDFGLETEYMYLKLTIAYFNFHASFLYKLLVYKELKFK